MESKSKKSPFIKLENQSTSFSRPGMTLSTPHQRNAQTLEPISEEERKIRFKESFSHIKRAFNIKVLGGGPMYPIPAEHEKKIIDLDDSCHKFKSKYNENL